MPKAQAKKLWWCCTCQANSRQIEWRGPLSMDAVLEHLLLDHVVISWEKKGGKSELN